MKPTENSPEAQDSDNSNGLLPWTQLFESLYDFLNRRKTTIEYEFAEMEIAVPKNTGLNPERALWKLNGTVRLRTWES
jgi:hypothetical protein